MLVTQRGSSTSRSPQKRVALRVVCMKVGGNTLRHPCLGFADTLTHTKNVTINTRYQTWPLSLYQSFFFFSEFSINSSILSHNEDYLSLLSWFLVPAVGNVSHWLLCYRSSRDGAVDEYFHNRCDRLNDTITVIRVNNYVFGGYVDIPWGNYFPSFLFGSVRTTNEYTATKTFN